MSDHDDHDDGDSHGDHAHGGGHSHSHGVAVGTQRKALWIALVLNAGFLGAEIAGGIAFNSLALLADAAHMTSDVAGLIIALIAQSLMSRLPTRRHSFGLKRAEVLGAQVNGLLLVVVSGWIIYEAIRRLSEPPDVAGAGLLIVATLGLFVNLASAVVLGRAQGASLNMRGAFIHMTADAAGSVAAIAAGIAIIVWHAEWVDPVVSIGIALLVLWATWGLLRDTTSVLLEGTPKGLDPDAIEAAVASQDGVEAVHHLHLWSLSSDQPALSAHVVLAGEVTLHEAQQRGNELKDILSSRYGIDHATLELECHPCEPQGDELSRPAVPQHLDRPVPSDH
jgi:cobalt-zinc-cadmium efflux system protein